MVLWWVQVFLLLAHVNTAVLPPQCASNAFDVEVCTAILKRCDPHTLHRQCGWMVVAVGVGVVTCPPPSLALHLHCRPCSAGNHLHPALP